PWLDESFATFLTERYFLDGKIFPIFQAEYQKGPVGSPTESYATMDDYAKNVYYGGALMLDALRQEMGEWAFDEMLRSYVSSHRYEFVNPKDFRQALLVNGASPSALQILNRYLTGEE
ncbi:MAG: hypothetical protein Q7T11_02210, partial [Deltaproteobacteria bacterium]|nr:hypothetical protein [Deltaproteobacteria bacterium]